MANDVERMYYGGNQAPSSGVTRDDLHKFIMKIVQAQGPAGTFEYDPLLGNTAYFSLLSLMYKGHPLGRYSPIDPDGQVRTAIEIPYEPGVVTIPTSESDIQTKVQSALDDDKFPVLTDNSDYYVYSGKTQGGDDVFFKIEGTVITTAVVDSTDTVTQTSVDLAGFIETVECASGPNIGAVGTPSVSAVNDPVLHKTTLTFDYLKGEKGDQGNPGTNGTNGTNGTSAYWFKGTAVTGTGTGISAVVSGSKAGDMYLNSNTQDVYIATAANMWDYVCNIKGATGPTGSDGTVIIDNTYTYAQVKSLVDSGKEPVYTQAGWHYSLVRNNTNQNRYEFVSFDGNSLNWADVDANGWNDGGYYLVDQTYSLSSIRAQSGTAVAQAVSGKADKATNLTGATKTKITYNPQGIVTAGADLDASDIPNLAASKITSGTFAPERIGGTAGTSGQYLKSNGSGNAPSWDNTSNIVSGETRRLFGIRKSLTKDTYTALLKVTALDNVNYAYSGAIFSFTARTAGKENVKGIVTVSAFEYDEASTIISRTLLLDSKNISNSNNIPQFYVRQTVANNKWVYELWVKSLTNDCLISVNVVNDSRNYLETMSDTSLTAPERITECDLYSNVRAKCSSNSLNYSKVGETSIPVYVDTDGSVKPCGFQVNFGTPIAGTNVLNIVTT